MSTKEQRERIEPLLGPAHGHLIARAIKEQGGES
jgi:hypothetical protein